MKTFLRQSSGQALLVTLLVLSVVLTAGLSLVSRTVTDIAITEEESASKKAFEAAEAGIEEALRQLEAGNDTVTISGGDLGVESIGVDISSFSSTIPQEINPGEVATFWLNKFQLDGEDFPADISYNQSDVQLCWNGPDKIEVITYYMDAGEYKAARDYLSSDGGCGGKNYGKSFSLPAISFADNKFINIRFYGTDSSATLNIVAQGVAANLPEQGKVVQSTATASDSAVTRKIQVQQGWPRPPAFFDFVVFSGGSLAK